MSSGSESVSSSGELKFTDEWFGRKSHTSSNILHGRIAFHKKKNEEVSAIGPRGKGHGHKRSGRRILQRHLKDMLLEGEDHDVTLKVKGRQFKAHKCILRARSPVFSAMFAHKMKESKTGNVDIEDCDPEAFGEFLQYVYSGELKNLSSSNALELYHVGEKYEFPDLKETCVEFLKESLSTNIICDVITLAMQYGEDELIDCAMSFLTAHLMEVLMSVEWQRFLTRNPIQANEFNIRAMKSYQRFR